MPKDVNFSTQIRAFAITLYAEQIGYRKEDLTKEEQVKVLKKYLDDLVHDMSLDFKFYGIVHDKEVVNNFSTDLEDKDEKAHIAAKTINIVYIFFILYNLFNSQCSMFNVHKSLSAQSRYQSGRHGLVVAFRIAAVGEYLCQGSLAVHLHEILVLGQLFLGCVERVDQLGCVVVIHLVVDEGGHLQSVAQRRLFGGPSHGQGGYGHHQSGQTEHIDDAVGHIDGGAEVTIAKALLVGQVAEGLGEQKGIGGGIDETQEIVVARCGLTLLAPTSGAAEVGADGQHHRGTLHHRLVEVGGGQQGFLLG